MDRNEALKRTQELLDYYGTGKYKGYEEIKQPDGTIMHRITIEAEEGGTVFAKHAAIDAAAIQHLPKSAPDVPKVEGEPCLEIVIQKPNERDTHFAGFARLLWQDLEAIRSSGAFRDMTWDEQLVEEQKIIAQCAYDLACHIEGLHVSEWSNIDDFVSSIPDITEWPEQNG